MAKNMGNSNKIMSFFKRLSKSKNLKKNQKIYTPKCSDDENNICFKHFEYKDENNVVKIGLVPEHMTIYSPNERFPLTEDQEENEEYDEKFTSAASTLYTPSIFSINEKYMSVSEDNSIEDEIINSYTYSDDSEHDNIFKGGLNSYDSTPTEFFNKKIDNLYIKYNYSPRSSINSISSLKTLKSYNTEIGFITPRQVKLNYILDKYSSEDNEEVCIKPSCELLSYSDSF